MNAFEYFETENEESEADSTKANNTPKEENESKVITNNKKSLLERKRKGRTAAKKAIQLGSSNECDWKSNPLSFIKGELCGGYYKVLNLNKNDPDLDKSQIKKAFRQISLEVHPDKNPSDDAQSAFKIAQEAYECLTDEVCKNNYDNTLLIQEENHQHQRQEYKKMLVQKAIGGLDKVYYHLSILANTIYKWNLNVWDWAGDMSVTLFDEEWSLGRPLLILGLIWKGQFLLKLHILSYIIVRINNEITRSRDSQYL